VHQLRDQDGRVTVGADAYFSDLSTSMSTAFTDTFRMAADVLSPEDRFLSSDLSFHKVLESSKTTTTVVDSRLMNNEG